MTKDAGMYAWIKREETAGNIYQEIDGFFVWAPKPDGGALNEHALIAMYEYLRARNAYWEWQINHDPTIGSVSTNDEVSDL